MPDVSTDSQPENIPPLWKASRKAEGLERLHFSPPSQQRSWGAQTQAFCAWQPPPSTSFGTRLTESSWCLRGTSTLQSIVTLYLSWLGLNWSAISPWRFSSLIQQYYLNASTVSSSSPPLRAEMESLSILKRKTTLQTTLGIDLKYLVFLKWSSDME